MKGQKILFVLRAILIAFWLWIPWMKAGAQGNGWSAPLLLSTDGKKASDASLVSDEYGFTHIFWVESLPDFSSTIQYVRFDGQTWSTPTDIFATKPYHPVESISPFVDQDGILHLIWTEGLTGPAFYSLAPANNATSAQNWSKPVLVAIPAKKAMLAVDSNGVFHAVYIKIAGNEPGIYYVRSLDRGINWSESTWLDPDILPGYTPGSLQFSIDSTGGLHTVWHYVASDFSGGDWVRYAHSLDGGLTWSKPFTIDRNPEGSDYLNALADPVMTVQGKTVHVIWAAGELLYRHYRYSEDAGQTWSVPIRVFGDLNGQAGDGFAVDGIGRIHYFAQIRFPMGIYHAVLSQNQWSSPSLIYLIQYDSSSANKSDSSSDKLSEDRILAHATHPIVRAGNQLILTFTDNPSDPERGLFVMYRALDDLPQTTPVPTPTATATLVPQLTPTVLPTAKSTLLPENIRISPSTVNHSSPGSPLLLGSIPVLLLILGAIASQLIRKQRQ